MKEVLMECELIDELNSLTGENYQAKDLVLAKNQGHRSKVYCVAKKYAIKTDGKDYFQEKTALERLKQLSFVPKIYGYNDQSKTIYMEWISGTSFFEYISLNSKIPEGFLENIYEIKVQMFENLCTDYDDKWSELFWANGEIKKVDYGQVDTSPFQDNLKEYYQLNIKQTQIELQQLKNDDDDMWKKIENKFRCNGISSDSIEEYRKRFSV